MKTVILAGGFGTRLAEATDVIPKPMVEIGGKPILWHIMKIYSHYGFNDFIILTGYKDYIIKEYFANYYLHQSDVTFDLAKGITETHNSRSEPWKVTILNTGLDTQTGGRILQAKKYVGEAPFMLTYGDGVADIDIDELLAAHKKNKGTVTMTTVQPAGRFGEIESNEEGRISRFMEKPMQEAVWINGGFMVCEPAVFDYLENEATVFERAPLESLAKAGELYSYRHYGFWRCMDTLRDQKQLNVLWNSRKALWKVWK